MGDSQLFSAPSKNLSGALIRDWSLFPSFELRCRPASSPLRYRADPTIYSAEVNFPYLAYQQIRVQKAHPDRESASSLLAERFRLGVGTAGYPSTLVLPDFRDERRLEFYTILSPAL